MPALRADLALFFEAFQALSPSRQVGLGIGPIPLSEIVAYADEMGLTGEDRTDLLRYVRVLDDEYIVIMNEREEQAAANKKKRKPKQQPPPPE